MKRAVHGTNLPILIRTVSLLSAALCLATNAQAYVTFVNNQGNPLRWNLTSPPAFVHTNVVNRNSRAVRYFIAADAFSERNRTAELNAVRASFGQWQSIPGALLKFEEGGLVNPGVDINTGPADQTNVVFWAKRSTLVNGGREDIRGLRGLTVVSFATDHSLLQADIVLNGVEFEWLTDVAAPPAQNQNQPFIEATLLHEIGHFVGLDHSPAGGATVTRSGPGFSTELGLSSDEIAAARALYPNPSVSTSVAHLRGQIRMGAQPVFGAMVTAENAAGNLAAATVSRKDGSYDLLAIPPGAYRVRASPLDPSSAADADSLMRGQDIASDYVQALTSFRATTNHPLELRGGTNHVLNIQVQSGEPPFRITAISHPIDHPEVDTALRFAASVPPGLSNYFVGVVSRSLPATGTLAVTGDGVVVGPTRFKPNRFFGGEHVLSAPISVASNATPGLRTLVVTDGSDVAYANGYLEILPPLLDYNFDGLDDRFQRRHFAIFTSPEAAPAADPDQDGFDNAYEFRTGSDPVDGQSRFFGIESVKLTALGATIRWQSAPGKRFQVFRRHEIAGGGWQPVGGAVTARDVTMEFLDAGATNGISFYRVEALVE